MSSPAPSLQGASLLRAAAYVVVVIAGLRAASSVLVPVLTAALLALVFLRPVRFLRERGLPAWVAALVVVAGATALSVLVSAGLVRSVAQFQRAIPRYEHRLREIERDLAERLGIRARLEEGDASTERAGGAEPHDGQVPVPDLEPVPPGGPGERSLLTELLGWEPGNSILSFFGQLAAGVVSVVSSLFVILLVLLFILLEASGLPEKLREAFGERVDVAAMREVGDKVFGYLWLKTLISLATGGLVFLLAQGLHLDFPALWGLLAFVFNYVPTIGSIIAAIPAVLLGLVQEGFGLAALVAAGYLAINVVLGNLIEPRLLGRRLGLSALVVWLSLLFWSWVWGPVGMLLSIPITMVVKIVLEHTEDYRFVAVLLGPSPSDPR